MKSWHGILDAENYQLLFDQFRSGLTDSGGVLSDMVCVEFDLDSASFRDHRLQGWAMTIWNNGYEQDDIEAHTNWAAGVRLVEQFFAYYKATPL